MSFCSCGALMVPKKTENGLVHMHCPSCGKILAPGVKNNSKLFEIKHTIRHNELEKTVIIENPNEVETMPFTNVTCKKCGNNEAVYWQVQTRSADEAPTTFYRCKKCGNTWRDYG
ncbi:transcription factor S [Candidatus Hodarchaeum mangrovi]